MRRAALALAVLVVACGVKAPPRPPGRDDAKTSTTTPNPTPTPNPNETANPPSSVRPERSGAESKGDAGTP